MPKSRMLLSTAFVLTFLTAACTEDPEAAANEIFVASSTKWTEYQGLSPDDPALLEQRLALLTEIDANLQKIVTEYPSSSLAVEISASGAAKQIPWQENKSVLASLAEEVMCQKNPDSGTCVLRALDERFAIVDQNHLSDVRSLFLLLGGKGEAALRAVEELDGTKDRSIATIGSLAAIFGDDRTVQIVLSKLGVDKDNDDFIRSGGLALTSSTALRAEVLAESAGQALDAIRMARGLKLSERDLAKATEATVFSIARWASKKMEAGGSEQAKTTMMELIGILEDDWAKYIGSIEPVVATEVASALTAVGLREAANFVVAITFEEQFGLKSDSDMMPKTDVNAFGARDWLPELLKNPASAMACKVLPEALAAELDDVSADSSPVQVMLAASAFHACGDVSQATKIVDLAWTAMVLVFPA